MIKCAHRLKNFENVDWQNIAEKRAKKFIERSNMSLRSGRTMTKKEFERLDFVGRVVEWGKKKKQEFFKQKVDLQNIYKHAKQVRRLQAKLKKQRKAKSAK